MQQAIFTKAKFLCEGVERTGYFKSDPEQLTPEGRPVDGSFAYIAAPCPGCPRVTQLLLDTLKLGASGRRFPIVATIYDGHRLRPDIYPTKTMTQGLCSPARTGEINHTEDN